MSTITPYSSFTTDSLAADFPAADILIHADDATDGDTTLIDRVSGIVFNLSGAITKDANGLGAASNLTVSSITGTMPTVNKYVAVVMIGRASTASPTTGDQLIFGTSNSQGITARGAGATAAAAAEWSTAAPSPTLTTNNRPMCCIGYFDLVDTSSPAIYRILANDTELTIPNSAGTLSTGTDMTGLASAALASAAIFGFLSGTTNAGSRLKIAALLNFSVALTLGEIQLAAVEMARTQELFAGWRNRAAA